MQRAFPLMHGRAITKHDLVRELDCTVVEAQNCLSRLRMKGLVTSTIKGWVVTAEDATRLEDGRGRPSTFERLEGYGSGGKIALEEVWPIRIFSEQIENVLKCAGEVASAITVEPA
jgi:hypothetical protein